MTWGCPGVCRGTCADLVVLRHTVPDTPHNRDRPYLAATCRARASAYPSYLLSALCHEVFWQAPQAIYDPLQKVILDPSRQALHVSLPQEILLASTPRNLRVHGWLKDPLAGMPFPPKAGDWGLRRPELGLLRCSLPCSLGAPGGMTRPPPRRTDKMKGGLRRLKVVEIILLVAIAVSVCFDTSPAGDSPLPARPLEAQGRWLWSL